jgi:hypothetical protein
MVVRGTGRSDAEWATRATPGGVASAQDALDALPTPVGTAEGRSDLQGRRGPGPCHPEVGHRRAPGPDRGRGDAGLDDPGRGGSTEMAGTEDRMRFEWTASVAVQRVTAFDALPDPDAFPPASPAEDCTMALRVDCSAHRPPRR